MKARLRPDRSVANPRNTFGYYCGLRLALGPNPSLSSWSETSASRTSWVTPLNDAARPILTAPSPDPLERSMTSLAAQNLAEHLAPANHRSSFAKHAGQWAEAHANAPDTGAFIALLQAFRATGGCAPAAMVSSLLEEHQAGVKISLAKQIFTRQLFAFEWRGKLWIPMFQFRAPHLTFKPGPQRVRAALPADWSGWMVASWFAAAHPCLGDRRPVDMLDAHFSAVMRAAKLADSERPPRSFEAPDTDVAWVPWPVWRERRIHARP
jgi:hypothetical protein